MMEDCIFCKIATGIIPSTKLYEDEDFVAILDLGPATEGHTIIIPKEHAKDVTELSEKLRARVLSVAAKIGEAQMKALGASGFNIVQNNGISAGQTVFHFHMHVIPRYDHGEKIVAWNPGTVSPDEMAETADKIRKVL